MLPLFTKKIHKHSPLFGRLTGYNPLKQDLQWILELSFVFVPPDPEGAENRSVYFALEAHKTVGSLTRTAGNRVY